MAVEAFGGSGPTARERGQGEMAVLERSVLKLRDGKWDDFVEHGKKWDAVAEKHGFPPATRYRVAPHFTVERANSPT